MSCVIDHTENLADAVVEHLGDASSWETPPSMPFTPKKVYDPSQLLEREHLELTVLVLPYGYSMTKIGRAGEMRGEYQCNVLVGGSFTPQRTQPVMSRLCAEIESSLRNKQPGLQRGNILYGWRTSVIAPYYDPSIARTYNNYLQVIEFVFQQAGH